MSAVEAVVERMRELPPEKQQAVLDFVIHLQEPTPSPQDARQVMDRIRLDVERRFGTQDIVLPLLRFSGSSVDSHSNINASRP